eukprot:gene11358-4526_t
MDCNQKKFEKITLIHKDFKINLDKPKNESKFEGYIDKCSLIHKETLKNDVQNFKNPVVFIHGCAWYIQEKNGRACQDIIEEYENRKEEFFFIVGDATGIEKEVKEDIYKVFNLLNLEVQYDSGVYYSKDKSKKLYFFNNFTKNDLKAFLKNLLDFYARNVSIIFSGHASIEGISLCQENSTLVDETTANESLLLPTELLTMFSDLKHPKLARFDLKIYLNTCFALQFAQQLTDKAQNLFFNFLEQQVYSGEEEIPKDDFISKVYKMNHSVLSHYLKQMVLCPILIKWGENHVKIVPLSIGLLDSVGRIDCLPNINLTKDSSLSGRWRFKSEFPNPVEEQMGSKYEPENTQNFDDPVLHIFTDDGDTALFQIGKFNILIDGGFFESKPRYWSEVKKLQKIDYVILTHGDNDHFGGFQPLVSYQKDESVPKIINFIFSTDENLYRNWKDVAEMSEILVKHKNINLITTLTTGNKIDDKFHDTIGKTFAIDILLPTGSFLDYVVDILTRDSKEKIPKPKRLSKKEQESLGIGKRLITDINLFGMSFVIRAREKNYLFTGDCHSQDIADVLKKKNLKDFYYVDAPHHGSDHNQFHLLLEEIDSIENLVVSCNWKVISSQFLDTLRDTKKIKTVYFNQTKDSLKGKHFQKRKSDGTIKKGYDFKSEDFERKNWIFKKDIKL